MKKFYFLSAMVLFAGVTSLSAQQWATRYNGSGNGIDAAKGMTVDKSGNVYVTGSSNSGANSDDYITIKYNSSGVQQWLARYNGPGNGSDVPSSIFVDAAGNVYVTGFSDQLTGNFINNDVTTVKYNAAGKQSWVSRYDGDRQRDDAGAAVKADASGNVVVTGYTTVRTGAYTKKDFITIKYNSAGVQQWLSTYNGPANQDDDAVALGFDAQGNIYVTGTSFAGADPLGEQDYLTIKYNQQGVQQWIARYNGPADEPDIATGIAVDNAGNSYVTGYSTGNDLDMATIKYNTNGTQLWVARHDGPAHGGDLAYAVALDNSGNVYVAGSDQAIINNSDFCTIKYNSAGVLQWLARYASATKDNDEALALAVDASNNVYVTGYINGVSPSWDMATIKYNATGVQQWIQKYNGPGNGNDNGAAIAVDGSGNVFVSGTSLGKGTNLDFVTLKYSPAGTATVKQSLDANISTTQILGGARVYPNPASQSFMLRMPDNDVYSISITNVAGQKIFEERNVKSWIEVNCSKFLPGTYFINAKSLNSNFTECIVKEK